MARPNKEHKPFCCKMDKAIFDALEQFCSDTGFSKTAVVENALSQYIKIQSELQHELKCRERIQKEAMKSAFSEMNDKEKIL